MSVGPGSLPSNGSFLHPLVRARDWQDSTGLGELCQWWKAGGVGVCALVGFGGAGKTAIAERFLQLLPGGYPEHPKVYKDGNLAAPTRLLVFSFYDALTPDSFFAELGAWLKWHPPVSREDCHTEGRPTQLLSYAQAMDLLATAGRCLLVLDGLEKVQEDGSRGGAFGQILDSRLRDLVLRVSDGWLPQVSLVVTSRFRLYDPEAKRAWYYRQIEVEQLEPSAAIQLLRARGVRGTEEQLRQVAREQGFHALSVDLVGGYIAHFCQGESQRFSSVVLTQQGPADAGDPKLDPRLASLRDQERKFARITERYYQALAQSDPAALALLQRICLFRLSIDAKTLATIFTGKSKLLISGPELAELGEEDLLAKLHTLARMRLLEASKTETFTVHAAVRDGFLRSIDSETERLGHIAVCEGLEAALGAKPGETTSDPETLDLVEEIIYHTLAAGRVQEAWDIYWNRIGGFRNLGLRLGAYVRGDRICRAFLAGQPAKAELVPSGLSDRDQAIFVNGWGLYLRELGRLAESARCYHWLIARDLERLERKNASSSKENLANVLLLEGCLTAGMHVIEDALRLLEGVEDATSSRNRHSHRALAHTLRGDILAAMADLESALKWQHAFETHAPDRPLYSLGGVWHAQLLSRLCRHQEASRITKSNQQLCLNRFGAKHPALQGCNLLLADLACECGELNNARELQREAYVWASTCDAKEPLCWSALVQAKIELAESTNPHSAICSAGVQASLGRAVTAVEHGLRIARNCGYGIHHIDLLLVRAQLALFEGRAADAARDVQVALYEGVHHSSESGFPELLAATDPECLYAWGIAEGRHLLGEVLLLQAAQKLGQSEFVPKRLDRFSAEVRGLVGRAREQLAEALELWRKLRDPESEADINPRGERTRRVIDQLDGGVLTEYPLEFTGTENLAGVSDSCGSAKSEKETKTVSKKHVFLSYCRDNKDEVAKLHDELIAAGEAVWWDQDILAGQDWKFEIRQAMRNAYAVVLCLSQETAARTASGIYSEALDAIAAYREYSPGNIFLIPVRLSDCEIPPIEIDGTRTLDRIQFVDLFPAAQRAAGFARLVTALRATPHHL